MLPAMTHDQQRRRALDDGQWVRVTLPSGQRARVATRYESGRRVVVVRPIRQGRNSNDGTA